MNHAQFSSIVSNWISNTILPNVSEKAVMTRALINTFSEIIRIQPKVLINTMTTTVPCVKICGVVTDDYIDTQLVRFGLTTFFNSVNEVKLHDYIKQFPYTVNKDEINALCRALEAQESEQQCVTKPTLKN
jgi:hypothetical protein